MKKVKVKTIDGDEVTRLIAENEEDEKILIEMCESGEDEYNPGLAHDEEPEPTPMCLVCKHKVKDKRECKAFPEGIPWDIYSEGFDHRESWEGDHGIRFEAADTSEWEQIKDFYDGKPN